MDRCSHCNEPLQTAYTSGFKIVQTMKDVLRIAQRMKRCINPACGVPPVVWGSAQWRQIAPVSCTYGYDVIAQIGWLRQTMRQPFGEIHADLARRLWISESQVRALYHYRYLPLLACHEQQHLERLKAVAECMGLLLTLDGLAPEGGEPQLWLVRELLSGITLRCGWMSRQDQAAFVNFLQPIADLGLRVAALMSDKQRGLVPAVAIVFPGVPHAFCQTHYLDNAADPVAKADEAMKVALRQGVRTEIGELIRQEKVEAEGVLTVTGGLPSPVKPQPSAPQAAQPQRVEQERDLIVQDIRRRIRYLLTLKGRPPFRLAGLEMFERLSEVKDCLERLIAHQATQQLLDLQHGLQTALQAAQTDYADLRQAANWLEQIADLLDPEGSPARTGAQVRQDLFAYLDDIQPTSQSNSRLRRFFRTLQRTTHSYAPGLFHCGACTERSEVMCRACPAPTTTGKVTSATSTAVCSAPPDKKVSCDASFSAKALGNCSLTLTRCMRPSRPCRTSLPVISRKNDSVFNSIVTVSGSILVPQGNPRLNSSDWNSGGLPSPRIAHSKLCGIAI
jgi:hypothetical protein